MNFRDGAAKVGTPGYDGARGSHGSPARLAKGGEHSPSQIEYTMRIETCRLYWQRALREVYFSHMVDLQHLREQRDQILRLAASYGASNVRVFGSLARGEARSESDVDLLVDLAPGQSLLAWSALWQELESMVGARIDLAISSDLRPSVRAALLAEAIPL